jgi:oligopeptide transport system substrate-binding protein
MRWVPLLALAPLVLAAGCTRRETPAAAGIRTHTLLVGNQAEPASLDPHLLNAYTDSRIALALFEGLTVLDERTAQPLPGAAERWDVSPDGLTYTFHLRRDGRWSDGTPVTAADFAFSFQRILTPALGSTYAYMLWPVRGAEAFNTGKSTDFGTVGVEAPDPLTLRLRLERPTAYLLALASHSTWFPVPRGVITRHGRADARDNPWTRPGHLVGNGAFVLTGWQPNARVTVARNPHYHGAAANRLEQVVFLPIEQADAEERSFRAGQLHLTGGLPPSKVPGYLRDSPGLLRVEPQLMVSYLNFKVAAGPLRDPRVRRALALGIDRAALSARLFAGTRPPAPTFVPPGCGSYAPPAGLGTDFAAARALLAEAGFPGGRGLPPLTLQVLNDDQDPKVAEALQAMWSRELGVTLVIERLEQKMLLQSQQGTTTALGALRWIADYPDAYSFLETLRTGNGNNWTGWGSRAFDDLLDEAERSTDPARRLGLLRRAEELMLAEAPVAPLLFGARTYLAHPAVRHLEPSPLGLQRYHLLELAP